MMEQTEETYTCEECGSNVKGHQRYCHNCGAYLGADAEHISIFNNANLQSAFFFYSIYLFICLLVSYTGWFQSYSKLFWVEIVMAAIALFYARLNWPQIKPLLRFNNFSWVVLGGLVIIAFFFSLFVNISVNQINVSFFRSGTNLYDPYRIYEFPVLVMIYSIAFMPALFEELAFRGVLYGYLSRFLDDRLVVMVTGFVFAAIHLNFFSLVWLVPFGIFIGSLRRKYDTLWYGVIFHFVFNTTSCLYDLYQMGMLS